MVYLSNEIKARAERLGFSFAGVARAEQTPHFMKSLHEISRQDLVDLSYLAKPYVIEGRRDPASLLLGAKSVIILGACYPSYSPNHNAHTNEAAGTIASYAILPDYHKILREKARQLIADLQAGTADEIHAKIFIDSGPVMEKDMAFKAGTIWIGKHSLGIHPLFGSNFFLGCVLTDLDIHLESDGTVQDLCGSCQKCVLACPTRCIGDHIIEISRCVSYLTIEHKGIIPRDLRQKIGTRIFGCDTCQMVCPYNSVPRRPQNGYFFLPEQSLPQSIDLVAALTLDASSFQERFSNTPIFRIGYERFMRNAAIAAGNSHNSACIPALKQILQLGSDLINIHAVWALGQFPDEETRQFLLDYLQVATSSNCADEIRDVLDLTR
jgi:epoxyqueuosine reductase